MAFNRLTNFIWIGVFFLSASLFIFGFFSADEKISLSTVTHHQNEIGLNSSALNLLRNHCRGYRERPMFKRMIFVLIDALRYDFLPELVTDRGVSSSTKTAMPFTERLLTTHGTIKFRSIAQTPTVTMPRLKAILAGIKPNFLDLIRNLNAASFNEDNFIDRAKQSGKRIVFYGDDTWLKMFSELTFVRHNLTYSFFATDYTEVDTNVTENMQPELSKLDQWDMMILHYLGVDHIGHSFGSKSALMPQKLREMDSVIKQIHESVSQSDEPYLIVVTGDHGMTIEGNHGGSSSYETETALLFINSKLSSIPEVRKLNRSGIPTIQQIDIAATISLLLGLPIPTSSQGIINKQLFEKWSTHPDQIACFLFENSLQLQNLIKSNPTLIRPLIEALNSHYRYIMKRNDSTANEILKQTEKMYLSYLKNGQKELFNRQDDSTLIGLTLQFIAISLNLFSVYKIAVNESREHNSVIFTKPFADPLQIFVLSALLLRSVLLASTSFIEMEHFFWPFLSLTIVIMNILRLFTIERTVPSVFNFLSLPFDYAIKIVGHLMAIFLIQMISSWPTIFGPTIGTFFTSKFHRSLATGLIIICLTLISFSANPSRFNKQQCILISGLFWVYLYRCDTNHLTSFRLPFYNLIPPLSPTFKARLVYLHLMMLMMENFVKRRSIDFDFHLIDSLLPKSSRLNKDPAPSILRTFTVCWILLICLLTKLVNIPLIAISLGLEKIIYSIIRWSLNNHFDHLNYFLSTYFTFGMTFHFAQGNSNDISTIEVAAGYIGLDSYLPMFTGILIASQTYSQLTFWLLMMFVRLTEFKSSLPSIRITRIITGSFSFLLVYQFFSFAFFTIVALILRNHLFIWSVISPKLLYEAFQSFIVFMIAVMVTICTQFNR